MMVCTLWAGPYCVVVWWSGWSGWLARYRWGFLRGPSTWPTVYAGPVKLITGPGLQGVWQWRVERNAQ